MRVFEKNSNIFKLLSEAISEGIIVVNDKQEIVSANMRANEMFGYKEEELVGRPLDILIPLPHRKVHKKHVTTFYRKHEQRRMAEGRNLSGLRKNGEQFPLEVGLNPFSLYGSSYVLALVIDITERKTAEQEIGHLAKIFDESLNEIYVFDAESLLFVNANQGARKHSGYSLGEFKKMTPLDLKPEFDEASFRKLISPLLDGTKDKIDFETVHRRKNGTIYPVEVHLQTSTLGDRQLLVAIILDISDRKNYTLKLEKTVEQRTKQLQKALEKEKDLNELKTKFLSLVSHEFKTPLSGILTSATLVGKYTKEDQQDKREKHLQTITKGVRYLTDILNDFLSMERLEKGKEIYRYSEFSLSRLVNDVIYNNNMLLKSGQRINYPENIDDIDIYQDEKVIALILTNLLGNAVKYSPEDSEIDLKVELCKDKIIFHIKDNGIGIPEKEQKYTFDRYFRAENVLTTQGTGIGLNIVKGHVENLGGEIYFKSEEDVGSTFSVELPLGS